MKQHTLTGGQLIPTAQALGDLANNRLPWKFAFRVRRLAQLFRDYATAYSADVQPYFDSYANEWGEIQGREKIEAFERSVAHLREQQVVMEFEAFSLKDLEEAFGGRDVELNPKSLDILIESGVIIANEEEGGRTS